MFVFVLSGGLGLWAAHRATGVAALGHHATVEAALEQAHGLLATKFLAADGLLLDYIGEIPTPKDCLECRPNAMGWWSPIENGPMFTGPYLVAMCEKARRSGSEADRALCRRMAKGLVKAASVSDVPGMIVRGFGTDGTCHYPLGSEDQTVPWFFGLHAYAMSGIPDAAERQAVVAKMREVADVLEQTNWQVPSDGRFRKEFRGNFKCKKGLFFRADSHYLFMLRAMQDVTGDAVWKDRYEKACGEAHPLADGATRLDICAQGYSADLGKFGIEPGGLWIYVVAQGCLRKLSEMDTDPARRAKYVQGLRWNAARVRRFFGDRLKYDNSTEVPFKYANWRTGYKWEEQTTQAIAGRVAGSGDRKILGYRKDFERRGMTAPLSACAIAAYSGDTRLRADIAEVLRHYDYATLNVCEFFLAECAWYALPEKDAAVAPGQTKVSVGAGARQAFNRRVIGVNHLAYGGDGRGYGMIRPDSHELEPELVALQKEIGFRSLRYPGGCGGTHHFEWKKNAGLAGPYNVMGVMEFLAMCEAIGAEPILGLSAHRGSPEEAAEYVEFLNAPADDAHPWARKRAERGHPEPYGVKYFEYGNEVYHGKTCSSFRNAPDKGARVAPEAYSTNFLAFRRAMQAVDPRVRLGAVLEATGGGWDAVVKQRLGEVAEFFVVHTYAQVPERDEADYPALFTTRTDQVREALARAKAGIGPQAELAVTEFNARFTQHKTLSAGLVNLSTLMDLAAEPRVAHADYWQFVNEGFGMVRGNAGNFVKRPNAWVVGLFSRYTLDTLVPAAVADDHAPVPVDPAYPAAWRGRNVVEGQAFAYTAKDAAEATGTAYERLPDGTHKLTFLDDRGLNFYHLAILARNLPKGDDCVWRVSYEMWTDFAGSSPVSARLELVDGRGWVKTRSAKAGASVSERVPVQVSFDYEPLRDNPGSLELRFRRESAGAGSVYVRNLRLEAVPKTHPDVPAVRAQLSVARDGRSAAGVFINRLFTPQRVELDLAELLPSAAAASGEVLSGPGPYATNEKTADAVAPKPLSVQVGGGRAVFDLPPHAAAGIRLEQVPLEK